MMARPKSLGSYAKLSASYYHDDAILEAGERAETLFTRGIAYCSGSNSDGFISDRQLRAVVGIGMRDVEKRASVLVKVGLWVRVDGGYVVRSWLKWHKSAEEIGRYLAADRARKAKRNPAGVQEDSGRIPDGIREDSSDQSSKDTKQEQEQDTNTPSPAAPTQDPLDVDGLLVTPDGATVRDRKTLDEHFDDLWAVYPRKVGKDDARRAWDKARKRSTVEEILAGAKRLRDDPNLPATKWIPHPATWLTRGGWNDDPLPADTRSQQPSMVANGHTDHWANGGGFYQDEGRPA